MMFKIISNLIRNTLIWLPEKNIGYYPVEINGQYDKRYFDKYVAYENTDIGKRLMEFRIDLANKYAKGKILDIGIGCGTFIKNRGNCYGYDINYFAREWLLKSGVFHNPYLGGLDTLKIEALTFFDSLEHIPDLEGIFKHVKNQYLIVSIPIFKDLAHLLSSQHFRKDEHFYYFTVASFITFMKAFGFELLEYRDDEIQIGRDSIYTFVFRRKD